MEIKHRRSMAWLPWLGAAAFGALYAAELGRELADGYFPAGALPFLLALGVPLVLLLALVIAGIEQALASECPAPGLAQFVHRVPRLGLFLFAGFVGLFALDVFGAGYDALGTLIALFMHLIPTFSLLTVAALAWRWPLVGAVACAGWAAWWVAFFGGAFAASVWAILVGSPLLIGVLFVLDWARTANSSRLRRDLILVCRNKP